MVNSTYCDVILYLICPTVLRLQESERIRMYVEDKLSALENEGKEKPEKITKVQFFLSKCVV